MPWSEWITPPPTETVIHGFGSRTYSRSRVELPGSDADLDYGTALNSARAGSGAEPTGVFVGQYCGSETFWTEGEPWAAGEAQIEQDMHSMEPALDPETWQDPYPALLMTLEDGTDFTIRPGKTPDEDDAYVEYEDASNTLIGWASTEWTVTMQAFHHSSFSDAAGEVSPNAIPYRVAVVDPLEDGEPMGWPAWDVGEDAALPFADFPGLLDTDWILSHTAGGEFVVDISSVPPRFGLLIQPTSMHPLFESHAPSFGAPFPSSSGTSLHQHFEVIDPTYSALPHYWFQQPRFRYWIPGKLPLRQRQRDDSLALGSPRQGKQTSRQGSIRQRGYL